MVQAVSNELHFYAGERDPPPYTRAMPPASDASIDEGFIKPLLDIVGLYGGGDLHMRGRRRWHAGDKHSPTLKVF